MIYMKAGHGVKATFVLCGRVKSCSQISIDRYNMKLLALLVCFVAMVAMSLSHMDRGDINVFEKERETEIEHGNDDETENIVTEELDTSHGNWDSYCVQADVNDIFYRVLYNTGHKVVYKCYCVKPEDEMNKQPLHAECKIIGPDTWREGVPKMNGTWPKGSLVPSYCRAEHDACDPNRGHDVPKGDMDPPCCWGMECSGWKCKGPPQFPHPYHGGPAQPWGKGHQCSMALNYCAGYCKWFYNPWTRRGKRICV